MHFSGWDNALWGAGVLGELSLFLVLLRAKSYRTFPIFFIWITVVVVLEPTFYWFSHHLSAEEYYRTFFALSIPQYLLEIAVLFEIAREVLSPVRKSLPRGILSLFLVSVVLIGIIAFWIAARLNAATLSDPRAYTVLSTTVAILRLTTFSLIAAFSQLLGLTWKNHVMQLASGLAFYAAISLAVELAHSHLRASPSYYANYVALDHLRIGGYLCALYFWCYAFAKKEAPRKEFSPQMAQFLVSISGSTKRQRAVLARTRDQ